MDKEPERKVQGSEPLLAKACVLRRVCGVNEETDDQK